MSTGIDRPIELAPDKQRALLVARRGTLVLPMSPQPLVEDRQRRILAGALIELGYLFEPGDSAAGLLDAAFREGVLPDLRCPWGRGGDVLWCREPWQRIGNQWRYGNRDARKGDGVAWLPAVRMPRAAARLVLKIDDVGIGYDEQRRLAWAVEVERLEAFA